MVDDGFDIAIEKVNVDWLLKAIQKHMITFMSTSYIASSVVNGERELLSCFQGQKSLGEFRERFMETIEAVTFSNGNIAISQALLTYAEKCIAPDADEVKSAKPDGPPSMPEMIDPQASEAEIISDVHLMEAYVAETSRYDKQLEAYVCEVAKDFYLGALFIAMPTKPCMVPKTDNGQMSSSVVSICIQLASKMPFSALKAIVLQRVQTEIVMETEDVGNKIHKSLLAKSQ